MLKQGVPGGSVARVGAIEEAVTTGGQGLSHQDQEHCLVMTLVCTTRTSLES